MDTTTKEGQVRIWSLPLKGNQHSVYLNTAAMEILKTTEVVVVENENIILKRASMNDSKTCKITKLGRAGVFTYFPNGYLDSIEGVYLIENIEADEYLLTKKQ